MRRVDIHRRGRKIIGGCGLHDKGVFAVQGATCSSRNVRVVERVVLEPEIQGRIVAGGLQQERQRHTYVVDAVRAAVNRVAFGLRIERDTDTRLEVGFIEGVDRIAEGRRLARDDDAIERIAGADVDQRAGRVGALRRVRGDS